MASGLAAVAIAALAAPNGTEPVVVAVRGAGVVLPIGFALYRLAHERRDRFALLLLAAGAMSSLTILSESSSSTLYSLGRASVWLVEPVLVYLILAFPGGRLKTRAERRLAAAVAGVVALLYLPSALLAPFPEPSPWTSCGTGCPSNAFLLSDHTATVVNDFMRPLRETLSVVLFGLVTLTVARRAWRSGEIMRRVLAPVVAVAGVRTLALGLYFVARGTGPTAELANALGWVYVLSLPIVTLGFAAGLLAQRLFVADALERLTRAVSSRPTAREVRTSLAAALQDPSLEVVYWLPGRGWLGETGAPVAAPHAARGRAVTEATAEGRTVAAIVHDRELTGNRALLDGAKSYVVTALENRELVEHLRSSLEELTQSRARLVTAADDERRKIERDMHDGAQQRLVALQINLELLAERLDVVSPGDAGRARELEDDIAATLDEVRRFSRGVFPPLLADRGLDDALHAVARNAAVPTTVDARLPHRYPREVESAVYFACSEALQNAAKHAHGATCISIAVSGNGRLRFDVTDNGDGFDTELVHEGSGLTNLRDRVGALGGSVEVASAPGRGTRVTGMIPID